MQACTEAFWWDEAEEPTREGEVQSHFSFCGRLQRVECNGVRCDIDWDVIDPLGSDDESASWRKSMTADQQALVERVRRERRASFEAMIAASNEVNRTSVWSPCGRYERFQLNGQWIEVDWNEIDPPGTDYDAPGIPHEQVMEEIHLLCEELDRQS